MKHILLTILFCYSINSVAQDPSPELFQTWYLYYIQADDLNTEYEISEMEPPITPTLTISQNLNFNGEGACNLFNGTFGNVTSTYLETIAFSRENDDCGIPDHNFFETSYFDFMQFIGGGWYEITSETNGMILTIVNPLGGIAIFKNYALSVMNFALNDIQVYPNPSSSKLFIEFQNTDIKKIELFNSNGLLLKTINENFESIQISDLSTGTYVLKNLTEIGTIARKIIKE